MKIKNKLLVKSLEVLSQIIIFCIFFAIFPYKIDLFSLAWWCIIGLVCAFDIIAEIFHD